MKSRVLHRNQHFELREEHVRPHHVRPQNRKKLKRVYRIRYLGWLTPDVIQRMNRLIDPNANSGRTSARRFRSRARAEQAFVMLTLGWQERG